jgi:hypothetical protein
MPSPERAGRKTLSVGQRYRVDQAHPKVRALFAAACQWNRCLPFPVDGGPGIGALAELVVHYCRAGMGRNAKRGQSGYDCRDALGRCVQIKAIGHEKPYFQSTIDPEKADRLIVLRIHLHPAWWEVIYDGPTTGIPPGEHKPQRGGIVVLSTNLLPLAKPGTWKKFWHLKGARTDSAA